jgi:methylglutamate dehydrogenase subunit D
VPEFALVPCSSLASLAVPAAHGVAGEPGVTVSERTGIAMCSVLARRGAQAGLAERVQQAFGLVLPSPPRYSGCGPVAFAWAGPSQWLALGEGTHARAFALQLRSSLDGLACVIDQSDGRAVLRIGGPRARDALAKGILIDLDPAAFLPGDAAVTACGHIGVHFWQIDAKPTYEFAISRSFAIAFWEWLAGAAAEFGIALEHH